MHQLKYERCRLQMGADLLADAEHTSINTRDAERSCTKPWLSTQCRGTSGLSGPLREHLHPAGHEASLRACHALQLWPNLAAKGIDATPPCRALPVVLGANTLTA
jgi:hypothetical protein